MSNYLRWYRDSGTYFFTVKTFNNQPLFNNSMARQLLRQSIESVRTERPFELLAMVLLPEHLHTIWTMPDDDSDFSSRWGQIKKQFTSTWLASGGCSLPASTKRAKRNERGVWQRRFWEHLIRDRDDMANHMDYIHYNPIKHNLVECPHQWPYSSFHRWVKEGAYREDWLCSCRSKKVAKPQFPDIVGDAGE